jgi:hypothetical protein
LGFERYITNNRNWILKKAINGKLIRIFLNKKFNEKNRKVWYRGMAFAFTDDIRGIAEYYAVDSRVLLDFLNTKSLNTLILNNSMVGKDV